MPRYSIRYPKGGGAGVAPPGVQGLHLVPNLSTAAFKLVCILAAIFWMSCVAVYSALLLSFPFAETYTYDCEKVTTASSRSVKQIRVGVVEIV